MPTYPGPTFTNHMVFSLLVDEHGGLPSPLEDDKRNLVFGAGCVASVVPSTHMLSRACMAVLLLSLAAGCNRCGNNEISRIPAPDGKIEAVIFERDCGATTDLSTQISILPKGASIHSSTGNAFIGDFDRGAGSVTKSGGPPPQIRWLTNRRVVITIHPATKTRLQQTSVQVRTGLISREQVTVEYAPSR